MVQATQICNGVGSGNIADELMARAFWDCLPVDLQLSVIVHPEYSRHRDRYPSVHEYRRIDVTGMVVESPNSPGLLVGDTPVCESEGLGYPLHFIGARLREFHRRALSVDAVGVGV